MKRARLIGAMALGILVSSSAFAQDYVRLRKPVLSCLDRQDWDRVLKFYEISNTSGLDRFLINRPAHKPCMTLPINRSLYIRLRSTDGAVCVRPVGEFNCYWTSQDFLDSNR